MKSPSIKAMNEKLRIPLENAKQIKKLCALAHKPLTLADYIKDHCPNTHKYAMSCYGDPYDSVMWRRTMILHAVNDLSGTYGVEAVNHKDDSVYGPCFAEYLNTGDLYDLTLAYKASSDNLYITCPATLFSQVG